MTDRTRYTALIDQASRVYGLPFDLLEGQVLQESGGDPDALRYEHGYFTRYIRGNPAAKAAAYGPFAACSIGLLQVMVETAYEAGFDGRPEQLFDPMVGLTWGAKWMQGLLQWAGDDYRQALAAYNGGKGSTLRGAPYPGPVQAYVDGVYRRAGRTP